MTVTLRNDPELGTITDGCPVCDALRQRMADLTRKQNEEDSVHPNQFLAIFAGRLKHEKQSAHTVFGWRFIRQAREKAKAFEAEADASTSIFWQEFAERYLTLPVSESGSLNESPA